MTRVPASSIFVERASLTENPKKNTWGRIEPRGREAGTARPPCAHQGSKVRLVATLSPFSPAKVNRKAMSMTHLMMADVCSNAATMGAHLRIEQRVVANVHVEKGQDRKPCIELSESCRGYYKPCSAPLSSHPSPPHRIRDRELRESPRATGVLLARRRQLTTEAVESLRCTAGWSSGEAGQSAPRLTAALASEQSAQSAARRSQDSVALALTHARAVAVAALGKKAEEGVERGRTGAERGRGVCGDGRSEGWT
eukprot:scaffold321222_cov35-Tisochrysis_lutea.AAC.1